MIGEIVDVIKDVDPNNRNSEWFGKYITALRSNWVHLVDPSRCKKNKQIILSQQPMDVTKDSFKDKDFIAKTKFIPLGIWNRMLNIMVEETTKEPPQVELKAQDSQALSDRKEDILLLKYKHILEDAVNKIGAKVGEPAQMVGADKFKGNIDEFERLGLDPNDPDDISFYEQSGFQRLKYEIAGQNLINTIMKTNRFDEDTLRRFIIDILSVLSICMQTFVDALTGEIKYRYIFPEEAFGIFGDSEDGSDDVCKGFERTTTVREWLGMVGNSFDWDRDWFRLLSSINYSTGSKYTGFIRNGIKFDTFGSSILLEKVGLTDANVSSSIEWTQALNFKVITGYIEWNAMEATGTYLAKRKDDTLLDGQIPFSTKLNQAETKEYYKESFYQEQMYKSYYLATGFSSQFIYGFGKVYYQQLEGAFDEIAKGTLMYYRYEGKSAAEISEPYIDFANLTFYRMKWVVWHSKPQKEQYFLPELIKLSKGLQKLYPQGTNNSLPAIDTILQQVIEFKRTNFVDIRDFPEIDGRPVNMLPSTEGAKGGVDNLAISLQAITQWCEMQISEKIGLNDMRLGQQQNDRQGYKQGVMETQSSLNSTGYIYRMIQFMKQHTAVTTCNYAQDIVRFKDTVPYKYLLKILGADDFENLKLLGDFAQHRYGIFIGDYNANLERQRLMAAADRALDSGDGRGGITISQWGILMMEKDYKKGLRLLDFYKYKEAKKQRAQQLADVQQAQQNAMEQKKAEQQTEQMKGDLAIKREQVRSDGYKYAADMQYKAKVDAKQMGISGDSQKILEKTDAEKQIAENKATIELQKSLNP